MIASMLTINNFFEGDYREIKMNCSSVLQTALNNTYRKCLSTSVMPWSGVAQLANFSESNVYRIIYQKKFWEYETTKTISN